MKTIAVLLTVYNRKEKTLACLRCLSKQEIPEGYVYDVWLTNDGCTDGTPEAVRNEFPETHIVNGDGNLYWSRGMNKAWEAATKTKEYDYYLWLNDDTDLYPYAVEELLRECNKHENHCLVVGACQSLDHKKMTYGGIDTEGLIPIDDNTRKILFTNGNILLIPQSIYNILGYIDNHFHHGGGDFNYAWRARKEGVVCCQPSVYLGECDRHLRLSAWCNPEVPLLKRLKALYRPNAIYPPIYFYEQRIYYGVLVAFCRWLMLHVRCVFPRFWKHRGLGAD